MTLLLIVSLLSISVGAAGQVRTESYLARENARDSTLTGIRVTPANEEFAVWMPESPKAGTEQLIIDQRPLILSYYGLTQHGTEYAVISVSGLENKMGDLAHMLMLNLYSKLIRTSLLDESEKSEVAVTANYQRGISLNGYMGREYSMQARKGTGLWRFYSVGKKFYAVAASTTRKDNILIKRFLNSFALGTPKSAIIRKDPVQPKLNIATQAVLPARRSSTETWLIILRTFPKAERPKANQKMRLLRSLGYDAHIVETDYYPNLKKGYLAVAMGPHSRSRAEGVLNKVRSVAPGSYIKSGW